MLAGATGTPQSRDPFTEALTNSWHLALELRDRPIAEHCAQVGEWSGRLAAALGLTAVEVRRVTLAGRLHDIGKITLPERLLHNSDGLSAREMIQMQGHARHGERILAELADLMPDLAPDLAGIAAIVGAHHERWDGTGYPRGLCGTGIPYGARIVTVADTYSAIITARSYQSPQTSAQALAILARESGRAFDPEIVAVFVGLFVAD